MERPPMHTETPEDSLVKKYQLLAGKNARFEKVAIHATLAVQVGEIIEGTLENNVGVGKPITFEKNAGAISEVRKIEETADTLLIHTTTSTYRLLLESSVENKEHFTWKDIAEVETAKGSTYKYLPDGTTQRFKKVENKEYDPQTALVYIPDYAWVKKHAPLNILEQLGSNELEYEQILLQYVYGVGNSPETKQRSYMVDAQGNKKNTNEEIEKAGDTVYLIHLTGGESDFTIPVSHTPRLGYYSYDMRYYEDEKTGERMRERHMGNKVVKITLKDGRSLTHP